MSKLDIQVVMSEEVKAWVNSLRSVVERLEACISSMPASTDSKAKAGVEFNESEDQMPVKEPKAKPKSKGAHKIEKTEDEETFSLEEADEEESASEPSISIKDLIAACKSNRENAIKVLKKMKVKSVHDLKPTQYSKFLSDITL